MLEQGVDVDLYAFEVNRNYFLICPLPKSVDVFALLRVRADVVCAPRVARIINYGLLAVRLGLYQVVSAHFQQKFKKLKKYCFLNLSIVWYALNMCPQGMSTVRRTG